MSKRQLAALALVIWSALVIRLVAFKSNILLRTPWLILRIAPHSTGRANFIPLRTVWPQLQGQGGHFMAYLNLAGNILPFIPIGILLPFVWFGMTWPDALGLSLATGFAIEGIELFYNVGVFDVDDILLNALGVLLGYLGARRLRSR